MSYKSRRAGKSTREMANKRRQSALWTILFGIMVLVGLWVVLKYSKGFGIGGIGILILLFLIRIVPDWTKGKADRNFKEEKRAIRGAEAEEEIDELLEDLSDDYYVLNDIESPYGNIDHIVISKNAGIFLVETKAHGGKVEVVRETILVNGELPEKDFIAQALRNSYWLRDEISQIVGSKPWITPIIVFTNAFVSPTRPIKGVRIVNKKYLLNTLYKTGNPNSTNAQMWDQKETIENRLV